MKKQQEQRKETINPSAIGDLASHQNQLNNLKKQGLNFHLAISRDGLEGPQHGKAGAAPTSTHNGT